MARTTFVIRDGELVEKHLAPPLRGAFTFMGDIAPFVTTCGTEIGSRSALREYERRHGVKQCGNDWTGPERPSWWNSKERSH